MNGGKESQGVIVRQFFFCKKQKTTPNMQILTIAGFNCGVKKRKKKKK